MSKCKASVMNKVGVPKGPEKPKATYVTVRRMVEKQFNVAVVSSDTVNDLKKRIEALEGIAVGNQTLDFGGVPLVDDNAKLSNYGIKHQDYLHVMEKACTRGWIQLMIKSPMETFAIGVCAQSTVMNLKTKIQEQKGIEMSKQRLVFQGTLLSDTLSLSSVVKQGFTVELYPALLRKMKVRILGGICYNIDVEDVDTGLVLKQKIFKVSYVPPSRQNVLIGEHELEDSKMMLQYGLKNNPVIWMTPSAQEEGAPITVFVSIDDKKRVRMVTGSHLTGLAFKKKLEDVEKIPVDKQRLFIENKEVNDSICMSDAGFVDGISVYLYSRNPIKILVFDGHRRREETEHVVIVDAHDRISDLKKEISKKLYINDDKPRLTYNKEKLNDDCTIAYYKIPNGGKVFVDYHILRHQCPAPFSGELLSLSSPSPSVH